MASMAREVVVPLLAAVLGGVIVASGNWLVTNREMNVKMVEIAVSILSQEPKDNIAPARKWAVDVISYYADVKPSQEVKDALVNYKAFIWGDSFWTSSGGNGSTYIEPSNKLTILKGPPSPPTPKSDEQMVLPPPH